MNRRETSLVYLTDGQLTSSISTISTVPSTGIGNGAAAVLICYNTSSTYTETILIQLARYTGTTRTLAQIILEPNESCTIRGILLDWMGGQPPISDALLGSSTNSNVVDYVLYWIPGNYDPWSITVYDASGMPKIHPSLTLSCK